MYPAYSQGVIQDDFLLKLLRHFKEPSTEPNTYHIVPILNGMTEEDYERSLSQYKQTDSTFGIKVHPLYAGKTTGLFGTLLYGYGAVAKTYPNATTVRMDNAEHSIAAIPELATPARETGGMVVGDLCFDDTTLLPNTPDWYAHEIVWPGIAHMVSPTSQLPLSCAHGFQAFGPRVLSKIFVRLNQMIEYMSLRGPQPKWGLDFGMVCSALLANVPVNIYPVRAESLRNRDLGKIADQLSAAATWVSAYAHIRK